MRQPLDVIKYWISTVNDEGRGLTEWELDFMDSLTEQMEDSTFISERQEEVLERLYSEKTP